MADNVDFTRRFDLPCLHGKSKCARSSSWRRAKASVPLARRPRSSLRSGRAREEPRHRSERSGYFLLCAVFCVYRRWRLSRAILHEIMQVFTRARGMTSGRAHASDVGNTSSRPCSLLLSFTIALVSESKKWRTTRILQDVLPCCVFAARQNVPGAARGGTQNKRPACVPSTIFAA